MAVDASELNDPNEEVKPIDTLGQLTAYALGLGAWGFGGPVALVSL